MDYTPRMLARLAHAEAAHELSERLVEVASTHADSWGRGAFLTEEAWQVLSEANDLLAAAVVTDRLRGASWSEVGEALGGMTKQSAHTRFAEAEREFREALLFPHRHPEPPPALGNTVAPYAVLEPDRVRERLDEWVVEHRRSSGPSRDEPEPVTRGLAELAHTRTLDLMGQVLELSGMLIHDKLPAGVSREEARRRHAELKVDVYERMVAERPDDKDVGLQLMQAREEFEALNATRGTTQR
jgi:hypothetical protein